MLQKTTILVSFRFTHGYRTGCTCWNFSRCLRVSNLYRIGIEGAAFTRNGAEPRISPMIQGIEAEIIQRRTGPPSDERGQKDGQAG